MKVNPPPVDSSVSSLDDRSPDVTEKKVNAAVYSRLAQWAWVPALFFSLVLHAVVVFLPSGRSTPAGKAPVESTDVTTEGSPKQPSPAAGLPTTTSPGGAAKPSPTRSPSPASPEATRSPAPTLANRPTLNRRPNRPRLSVSDTAIDDNIDAPRPSPTRSPSPAAIRPTPASPSPSPAATQPTPASPGPSPAATQPAPASPSPSPVATQPAPVSPSPSPRVSRPAPSPIATRPSPLNRPNPSPAASPPSPIVDPNAPFAQFPHPAVATPDCEGLCWRIDLPSWQKTVVALEQELATKGYTLNPVDNNDDTGLKVFEVRKNTQVAYYLHIFSSFKGVIYLNSTRILGLEELETYAEVMTGP